MYSHFLDINVFENPINFYLSRNHSKIGRLTEEFYYDELWKELINGSLNSKGSEFSFEVPICTEFELYEATYTPFTHKCRIISEKNKTQNFEIFQRALSKMPSGITYTKQDTCFQKKSDKSLEQIKLRFERGEQQYNEKKEVEINGYTVFVNVKKNTSQKIFNENYASSLTFKERLLREHREILRNCTEVISFRCNNASFTVDSEKVTGKVTSEEADVVSFFNLGMVDLKTPAEIYGFASAMITIAKQEGKIKENVLEHYYQSVSFQQEKADQKYYDKHIVLGQIGVSAQWDFAGRNTPSAKSW